MVILILNLVKLSCVFPKKNVEKKFVHLITDNFSERDTVLSRILISLSCVFPKKKSYLIMDNFSYGDI